jgi:hypothetical protein
MVVSGLLLVLQSLTLNQRHLWADEVETAERARIILDKGLPVMTDQDGRISVNAAGKEIEDSDLHRYTPWMQFYTASLGLYAGHFFEKSNSDFWVRWPFVILHSLSSAIIAAEFLPFSVGYQITAGVFYGMNSVQFVHHRTARYHALLEFFLVLGLLGLKLQKKWALWMSLPLMHTQTLAGLVASGVLVGFKNAQWKLNFKNLLKDSIPGAIAFIGILILCRPWLQSAWGGLGRPQFNVLKDPMIWPWFLMLVSLVAVDHRYNKSKKHT